MQQVPTCVCLYGLAEGAAALIVTGGDCQCIEFATLEPRELMGRLGGGVVGADASIFPGLDKVVDATFWTGVPGHCDVIVVASCHSGHTGRWADH